MGLRVKGCFVLACMSVTLAAACGGGEKAAPGAKAPAEGTSLAVAEGDFGVPECDSYMRKYMACLDSKVPEAARPMLKQALDQTKAAWKQAASTPAGKAGLAAACTQAEATAKQSMAAYGCEW
jgi:hypothetical protein